MKNKKGISVGLAVGFLAGGITFAVGGIGSAEPTPTNDQEVIADLQHLLANEQARTDLLCDKLATELGVERPQGREHGNEFDFLGGMGDPLWLCATG